MRSTRVALTASVVIAATAFVLAQTSRSAPAQTVVPAIDQLTALHTVADAEAEGAAYPTGKGVDPRARKCVDVNAAGTRAVTSGDFEGYNFPVRAQFVNFADPSRPGIQLWWTAKFPDGLTKDSLLVRVARLDGAPEDRRVRGGEFIPPGRYNAMEWIPDGRWLFVVTAGVNWGCFVGVKKDGK